MIRDNKFMLFVVFLVWFAIGQIIRSTRNFELQIFCIIYGLAFVFCVAIGDTCLEDVEFEN